MSQISLPVYPLIVNKIVPVSRGEWITDGHVLFRRCDAVRVVALAGVMVLPPINIADFFDETKALLPKMRPVEYVQPGCPVEPHQNIILHADSFSTPVESGVFAAALAAAGPGVAIHALEREQTPPWSPMPRDYGWGSGRVVMVDESGAIVAALMPRCIWPGSEDEDNCTLRHPTAGVRVRPAEVVTAPAPRANQRAYIQDCIERVEVKKAAWAQVIIEAESLDREEAEEVLARTGVELASLRATLASVLEPHHE